MFMIKRGGNHHICFEKSKRTYYLQKNLHFRNLYLDHQDLTNIKTKVWKITAPVLHLIILPVKLYAMVKRLKIEKKEVTVCKTCLK